MDERLKNYCDISKIFLDNVVCIQDCLLESNKTQKILIELVELRSEFEKEFARVKMDFDKFLSKKRVEIKINLDRNSVKNITKEVIEDRVIALFPDEYAIHQSRYDETKLNVDLCNDLRFIFLQRKDLICHTIDFLKHEKDRDNCIFNNQKLMEKVMGAIR